MTQANISRAKHKCHQLFRDTKTPPPKETYKVKELSEKLEDKRVVYRSQNSCCLKHGRKGERAERRKHAVEVYVN